MHKLWVPIWGEVACGHRCPCAEPSACAQGRAMPCSTESRIVHAQAVESWSPHCTTDGPRAPQALVSPSVCAQRQPSLQQRCHSRHNLRVPKRCKRPGPHCRRDAPKDAPSTQLPTDCQATPHASQPEHCMVRALLSHCTVGTPVASQAERARVYLHSRCPAAVPCASKSEHAPSVRLHTH